MNYCGKTHKSITASTTNRIAGSLDFAAIGGKRQGREVPPSLRVKPGAKHLVGKNQLRFDEILVQIILKIIFGKTEN